MNMNSSSTDKVLIKIDADLPRQPAPYRRIDADKNY